MSNVNKLSSEEIKKLEDKALKIRCHIVNMITNAASGHPGGSLSAVEILTALYFTQMNIYPQNPSDPNRDRFVLSKGHASPVLYSVLAERGFFDPQDLMTFRKLGTCLQGHPDMEKLKGIDMSTGSLGQGLSAACGMAVAGKLDKKDYRVYALLGDGELQEGQIWEAAMFASHYKLDNLTIIVDNNGLQIDGKITDVLSPLPIPEKWQAFGWETLIIDGHDYNEIYEAINKAKNIKDKPTAIIAKTVKGKGVCCMENQASWHGKAPSSEECKTFLEEIGGVK